MGKPARRLEFDNITAGWGTDDLGELVERATLMAKWCGENFPLSLAEQKVFRAISKRLGELGGVEIPVMQ
jgi:hypothetical protein